MKKSTLYSTSLFVFLAIVSVIVVLQMQGQQVIAEEIIATCPESYSCYSGNAMGFGSGSTRAAAEQQALADCQAEQTANVVSFTQCLTQVSIALSQCDQLTFQGLQCSSSSEPDYNHFYPCYVYEDACGEISPGQWECTANGGYMALYATCSPTAPPGGGN